MFNIYDILSSLICCGIIYYFVPRTITKFFQSDYDNRFGNLENILKEEILTNSNLRRELEDIKNSIHLIENHIKEEIINFESEKSKILSHANLQKQIIYNKAKKSILMKIVDDNLFKSRERLKDHFKISAKQLIQ